MGFKKHRKKGGNWNKKNSNNGQNWNQPRGPSYKDIVKENEKYWEYYRQQKIIPEGEWEEFRRALQTDLPVSFRIQGCHKDRDQLMNEMETRFFEEIVESPEDGVFVPKKLPWYEGAYQTPMSRTAVRSNPALSQLHNFLVTEAELGNLSRQEAVSMIPPLLLTPNADHFVLDLCAAPGSKTTQLMEMMHEDTPNPDGLLIANDLDKKRCYMLIHQTLKRFHTSNTVVTCEDAARLPEFKSKNGRILFDRILCDVICSGDGTLRKNPEIWQKWSPQDGLGLHRMQLAIAKKGAENLKVGGRMVYSTCSMNPIEDEAVVAELLRLSKGSLKLVDAHPIIPALKSLKGISHWKVFDRDMKIYQSVEEVDPKLKKMICQSCFPPTDEEIADLHLDYTMRIVPHHQDTGGFYVALLEKTKELSFQPDSFSGPAWKKKKMFKDEPFSFLKPDDERWTDIRLNYGVTTEFKYQNLFSRRLEGEGALSRSLFYANDAVKDFVVTNMDSISIQNAGMKMFSRTEKKIETRFRISQEGIRLLIQYMSKKKVQISKEDMLKLLKTEAALIRLETLDACDNIRNNLGSGGCIVLYLSEEDPVCAWVGTNTAAPYISKEERIHLLRMMGVDCAEIEQMMKTKRKEKAALSREEAAHLQREENEEELPEDIDDELREDNGEQLAEENEEDLEKEEATA